MWNIKINQHYYERDKETLHIIKLQNGIYLKSNKKYS